MTYANFAFLKKPSYNNFYNKFNPVQRFPKLSKVFGKCSHAPIQRFNLLNMSDENKNSPNQNLASFVTSALCILFLLVCSGCAGISSNPKRAERTIRHWLPVGTTTEDMQKIMKQHGFQFSDCFIDGTGEWDYYYGKETKFHAWTVQIHERSGKVDTTNFPTIVYFTLIEFRT